MLRKRIAQLSKEHGLQRLLTLTLDPANLDPGSDINAKIAFISNVWRKMRVSISRKLGKSMAFIAVMELQRNGNPHLHMLVDSYLPKGWIHTHMGIIRGGRSTRIEFADVHRAAAYLARYYILLIDTAPTRQIGESQRVIAYVTVKVPALRISRVLIGEGFMRTRKPSLCPREVPGAEVIEAGLRIPFFAGKAPRSNTHCWASTARNPEKAFRRTGESTLPSSSCLKYSCRPSSTTKLRNRKSQRTNK